MGKKCTSVLLEMKARKKRNATKLSLLPGFLVQA